MNKDISKLTSCPVCKSSWDGGDIPVKYREHYSPPYKYSRLIGLEDPKKYDGVSFWKCPDCRTVWNRWTGKIEKNIDEDCDCKESHHRKKKIKE